MLNVQGQARGRLRVRIAGAPIGGGLSMTGSQVDLRSRASRRCSRARSTRSAGSEFIARVTDSQGSAVELHAALQIDIQSDAVTGTLSGTPEHG